MLSRLAFNELVSARTQSQRASVLLQSFGGCWFSMADAAAMVCSDPLTMQCQ